MASSSSSSSYVFVASLWRWREGSWFFVTVPFEVSDEIDEAARVKGGFGSVRVEVTVGGSVWATSLFPSTEEEAFVLPVKKAVRVKEGLTEGSPVPVTLRLLT